MFRLRFVLPALAIAALSTSSVRGQISGFGGDNQLGWTANHTGAGGAPLVLGTGSMLDQLFITSADNGNNNSYFFNTAQPLTTGGWTANFTYQYTAGSATPADGITFTMQNDPRGAHALGGAGGNGSSLGYSGGFNANPVNGTDGIIKSESFHLNIFTSAGGGPGIGEFVNAGGASSGGVYTGTAPIVLNSLNNPVEVFLTYDGVGTMTARLFQPSAGNVITKTFAVPSFQQVIGGGNTFVAGFTGATGGFNAAQEISNFSFTPVGSQVAPVLDIFKFNDTIRGVNAVLGAGTANNSPAAEGPANSLDSCQPTKYLNFNKANAGIVVTPTVGRTVANELSLTSANDAPERDPASYEVWGTNETNPNNFSPDLNPAGWQSFWTLISSGSVPAFSLRGQEQDFTFANNVSYSTYMIDFPTLANATAANSMQIADIQLSGSVPEPGSIALLAMGGVCLALGARRYRRDK